MITDQCVFNWIKIASITFTRFRSVEKIKTTIYHSCKAELGMYRYTSRGLGHVYYEGGNCELASVEMK